MENNDNFDLLDLVQIESTGYYIEVWLADGLQYFCSYILGLKDVQEVLYSTVVSASHVGKVDRWSFFSRTDYTDGSSSEELLADGLVYYIESENKFAFTTFYSN